MLFRYLQTAHHEHSFYNIRYSTAHLFLLVQKVSYQKDISLLKYLESTMPNLDWLLTSMPDLL